MPRTLLRRFGAFSAAIRPLFPRRRSKFNLLRTQRAALAKACAQNEFLVVSCDKNLGPAIIERSRYIQMAIDEHLSDTSTYRRLTADEAAVQEYNLRQKLYQWLKKHHKSLSKQERKFIRTSESQCKDAFPYFYLLMKVHKNPSNKRVSGCFYES